MFSRRLWSEAQTGRLALFLTIAAAALAGVTTVLQAYTLSQVVDRIFLGNETLAGVATLLTILLAIIVLRAGLVAGGEVAAKYVAVYVRTALRRRLAAHLVTLGPAHAYGERTGELVNTLVEGIEALEAYFSEYLPQLFTAVLVPMTILVVVFPADLLSAVVMLVTAPLIPLFMVLIGRLAASLTDRQWRTLSLMSAHFLDVLQGLTTLKQLGRSRAQTSNIATITNRFRKITMGVLRVTFLSALVLELVATLSVAIVAVEIGLRLLNGNMTFATALFVLVLAPEFYMPLRMLGARFHAGMSGVSAAARIFELLDTLPPPAQETVASPPSGIFPLHLDDVHFAYDDGSRPALNGLSLHIARGQKVALVGASGAGKSTVASLLLRFIQPDGGEITANGRSLATIDGDTWRQSIAWVPQMPYLFHDTVAANIRLARPSATRAEVVAAAKKAYAHDFIQDLPHGYHTMIGERGTRLSGGQAQRLALARAFLKDAPFLILDEPTANLDPATEALLQEATEQLLAGRTALIIAHRLSTIYRADQIAVLAHGRLVEYGRHEELLQQDGPYRQFVAKYWQGETATAESEAPKPGTPAQEAPGAARATPRQRATVPSAVAPAPATLPAPSAGRRLLQMVVPFKWRVLLAVLLGALTIGSSIALLATSSFLISKAALQPSIAELSLAIVGVRFFGISRGVFRYLERLVSHSITFRLLARLRVWFYEALEPLAPARLMQYRSGDLLGRIVSDIEILQNFYIRVIAPPIVALIIAVATAAYLASFHWHMAVALLAFLLMAGGGLPLLARWFSRLPGQKLVVLRSELQARLVDNVQGMADLLAFGQQNRALAATAETNHRLATVQKQMARIGGFHAGASNFLTNGGMWVVLFLAIPLVAQGRIDGVYLAALAMATLAAFEAVQPLPLAAQNLESSLPAAQRLFAIVDTEPEVKPPPEPIPVPPTFALAVENLHFRYPTTAHPALNGISFNLPLGKRVAIVGPSGAGKSTLVNLLLRFWEYEKGEIWVNGRSAHHYHPDELRSRFGVISQNSHLFNATVRDNIRIARPQATPEEIMAAAQAAQIHDFISGLPQGYETPTGEQGMQLSGGERQRLAVARTLLNPTPLLILDEPTANLDPITESRILDTIHNLAAGRSLLLITHRLVKMEYMDEILVLDNGRIVERGRHEELLQNRGLYGRLWTIQNRSVKE